MNRNIHRQIAEERGVDTRFPSTANLLIDSADRNIGTSSLFSINPGQQLIPGAFTRAAVQEVVLEWSLPNIGNRYAANQSITVQAPVAVDTYTTDISGNVFEGETLIADYYDLSYVVGGSISRNPIILVNGLPTVIIPANLPLTDPEGAPIDINGAPIVGEALNVFLATGFYTVAMIMDSIAPLLTARSTGSFVTFTNAANSNYGCAITATRTTGGAAVAVTLTPTVLSNDMSLAFPTGVTNVFYPKNPYIMPFRYVDIICDQLTYCQDVKDSATGRKASDVLNRWNFGWSAPPTNDKYGFPILQGYQVFTERRNIGFPKQIKWDPIQTVSNLTFQSYVEYIDEFGTRQYILVPETVFRTTASPYEFQMTLLLSEV
jgi:hypothetical protein